MKKSLNLLLAIALVFSMFSSMAFAADANSSIGQKLQDAGVIKGDLSGNLNEDEAWTREQATVIIARLLGAEEDAQATEKNHGFTDVTDPYYDGFITWAQENEYFNGHSETRFGYGESITNKQFAVVMLRVLGIDFDDDWYAGDIEDKAVEFGIFAEGTDWSDEAEPTRGDLFPAIAATIQIERADGTTIAEEQGFEGFYDEVVAEANAKISLADGITNTLVEVTLSEAVSADDVSEYTIVDKDGKELAVTASEISEDGKKVTLTTASQTPAALYVVKANDTEAKFVGQRLITDKLQVVSSAAASSNVKVRVAFSADLSASALNPANYAIDNDLTVTNVAMDGKNAVILTTTSQTAGKLYTVTVSNVTDIHGNGLDSAHTKAYFGGKSPDTTGPAVVTSAVSKTNTSVEVTFSDDSTLDKASVENAANYSIDKELQVIAASYNADTKVVTLTTSSQTAGTLYTVTVSGVVDEFGNVVKSDANKAYFGGKDKDTEGPTVSTSAVSTANNKVDIVLQDASGINSESAVNVANYSIDKDLTVIAAEFNANTKRVTLTTSAQTAGTLYTVTVSGVTDEYGNVVKSDANKAYFGGVAVDTNAPTYTATSVDNTTVRVVFSKKVDANTARPYNFYIDGMGYALKAKVNTDIDPTGATVDITTLNQSNGKLYKLEVRNVTNLDGTAVKSDSSYNYAGKGTASTAAPKVLAAIALDKKTVAIEIDSDLGFTPTVTILASNGTTVVEASRPSVFDGNAKNKLLVRLGAQELAEGTLYYAKLNNAIGANGVAMSTDNERALFAGSGAEVTGPKVISAVAVDNNTVDVYFDKSIVLGGGAAASIALLTNADAAVNYADSTAVTAQALELSDDGKRLTVHFYKSTTTLTLTEGTLYKVRFNTPAQVQDVFGENLVTDANVGSRTIQFAAVATAVKGPEIVTAIAVDRYTVDVVFNKPINVTGSLTSKFALEPSASKPTVALARQEGADKVRVFFDETGATALNEGSVYTIRYTPDAGNYVSGKNGVPAVVNTSGHADVSFAAISTATEGPSISAVANVNSNTVKVSLSKATNAAVLANQITVTDVTYGATIANTDYTVVTAGDNKSFEIIFNNGVFEAGKTYSVALKDVIKDETGLRDAKTNAVSFGGVATIDLQVTVAAGPAVTISNLKAVGSATAITKDLRVRDTLDGSVVVAAISYDEGDPIAGLAASKKYILEAADGSVTIYVVTP